MTVRESDRPWDSIPLEGDLTWLEAYAAARASTRWTIVDRSVAAARSSMPWPWMVDVYDGMTLVEPEPEPPGRVKGWFR